MRYDRTVSLVKKGLTTYNEDTGDYEDGKDAIAELPASVADTSAEKMLQIYGKVLQQSYTVQLQGKHTADYLIIDGKRYHIDRTRYLRSKTVFTVSED